MGGGRGGALPAGLKAFLPFENFRDSHPTRSNSNNINMSNPVPIKVESATVQEHNKLQLVEAKADNALDQVSELWQKVDNLTSVTRPKVSFKPSVVTTSPSHHSAKGVEPPTVSPEERKLWSYWKDKNPECLSGLIEALDKLQAEGPGDIPQNCSEVLGFCELEELCRMVKDTGCIPSAKIRRRAQTFFAWAPRFFGDSPKTNLAGHQASYRILLNDVWLKETTGLIDEIRTVIAGLKAQESAAADAVTEAQRKAEAKAQREAAKAQRKAEAKVERKAKAETLKIRAQPLKTELRAAVLSIRDILIQKLENALKAKETPCGIEQVGIALKSIAFELVRIMAIMNSAEEIFSDEKTDPERAAPKGMTKLAISCGQMWPRHLHRIHTLLQEHLTPSQLETLKGKEFPPSVPMSITVPVRNPLSGIFTAQQFHGVTPYRLLDHLRDWALSCNASAEKALADQRATKATKKRTFTQSGDVPSDTSDEDEDDNTPIAELQMKEKKKPRTLGASGDPVQNQHQEIPQPPVLSPELSQLVDQQLADEPDQATRGGKSAFTLEEFWRRGGKSSWTLEELRRQIGEDSSEGEDSDSEHEAEMDL